MNQIMAFILAGGKSTRMGRDKAFLRLDGETLLSRMLKLAGTVTSEVGIVGDAEKFAAFSSFVVPDVYPDRGPLGGIHAALSAASGELNLILAVDLPFVEPEFLRYVTEQALASAAVVTVPRTKEGWQPLCAVYRRDFASIAEHALDAGKNKIDPLFAEVKTKIIDEKELARAGFSEEMFRNLNSPQDLEEAKRNFREEKSSL